MRPSTTSPYLLLHSDHKLPNRHQPGQPPGYHQRDRGLDAARPERATLDGHGAAR